jgi:beta-lactamase class A
LLAAALLVPARGRAELLPPDAASVDAEPAAPAPSVESRQLEKMLEEHVKELRRRGRLSPDERTAWSVYDFTTGKTLVEINADLELQSASLVKPFLALAFMSQVEKGKLAYNDESRRQMTRMIQISDNKSADWMMRRLGGPAAVERLLRGEFGSVLPGVEIKEYIPKNGRTFRNRASARDYSRFLLALWRDELPGSKEIKRLMALPKRDRLRTGVPLPSDVEVYDKTGTTSRLCGDIGVLTAKGPDGRQYSYTLVGIIEKQSPARNYMSWMRSRGDVIRHVSYMVYRGVGALHGFASAL